MAKIEAYRNIPLDDLVIGKGQVRTQDLSKGIEDLARSIEAQGLLQPIVVCAAREEGKWEILTGQRRFLAHKKLQRDVISAAVLDERVDEEQAKAISITENLIRRKLSGKELKDGILYLYNIYGNIQDVVKTTGLPRKEVQDNVKYPRLPSELKKMVDEGRVDVNAAVKALDASNDDDGNPDTENAIRLAQEMAPMSGVQRKKFTDEIKKDPDKPVEEAIERAKTGSKVVQIIATVTQNTHMALQRFAKEEGSNQDEAAVILLEEALVDRGLLEG